MCVGVGGGRGVTWLKQGATFCLLSVALSQSNNQHRTCLTITN